MGDQELILFWRHRSATELRKHKKWAKRTVQKYNAHLELCKLMINFKDLCQKAMDNFP